MLVATHKQCGAVFLLGLLAGCAPPAGLRPPAEAPPPPSSPYVRVARLDGKDWFVQDGRRFLSLGINSVIDIDRNFQEQMRPYDNGYNGVMQFGNHYPSWAAEVERRMLDWGFNTIGAWSHEYLYEHLPLYQTRVLWMGHWGEGQDMRLVDVWDDAYRADIEKTAREQAAPHREDTRLIGYFINNELPWYGEHGWPTSAESSLVARYMALPADAPGKKRLVEFLRAFHEGDYARLTAAWNTPAASFDDLFNTDRLTPKTPIYIQAVSAWAGEVAEAYFALCEQALKKYDPNHLNLGARFAGKTYAPVMEACARHCDVVSMNYYRQSGEFQTDVMGAIAADLDKPILITEFSWRAMENSSGCPNTKGAPVTVKTQQDRAERFRRYAQTALAQPYIIGYHWFCYADQPPGGRFDGEDSNWGLVDTQDRFYTTLLDAVTDVNRRADRIHANSAVPAPLPNPELFSEYRPVKVRHADASFTPVTLTAADTPHGVWGDPAAGAYIKAQATNGVLHIDVEPKGWGSGISFGPTVLPKNPDGSLHLPGASAFTVRLKTPAPFQFNMGLSESGVGPPGEQAYDGYGAADGESYAHLAAPAAKGAREYTFPFKEMEISTGYGNQRGNRTIDTGALRDFNLFFPGGQPAFSFDLEWIRIE